MQSQEHSFELPSCIEQEVQFCSFGSFFNCYSSVLVVIPCEFISLKHILLDKFRLYYISECGSSIVSFESAISNILESVKSIRNPSCSSEYRILKQLTTSLIITFIFQWQG